MASENIFKSLPEQLKNKSMWALVISQIIDPKTYLTFGASACLEIIKKCQENKEIKQLFLSLDDEIQNINDQLSKQSESICKMERIKETIEQHDELSKILQTLGNKYTSSLNINATNGGINEVTNSMIDDDEFTMNANDSGLNIINNVTVTSKKKELNATNNGINRLTNVSCKKENSSVDVQGTIDQRGHIDIGTNSLCFRASAASEKSEIIFKTPHGQILGAISCGLEKDKKE